MTFRLVRDPDVLRVVYSGVVTVPERIDALRAAFAETTGIARRVLVDFRDASSTPPSIDFETTKRFVDMLARETGGGSARVAYLTESDLPIDRCVELLIDSRRIPVRRFTHEAEALTWLCEDQVQQREVIGPTTDVLR